MIEHMHPPSVSQLRCRCGQRIGADRTPCRHACGQRNSRLLL